MSTTEPTSSALGWAEVLLTGHPLSADEWMALPEDRWRYEIVDGQLLRLRSPDLRYDSIAGDFLRTVGNFALATNLGRVTLPATGFLISPPGDPDTVLVPAVAFVQVAHVPDERERTAATYLRLVPDLVIEIAAPGQLRPAIAEKTAHWLAAGVRLVWVVWPNRRQVEASCLLNGALQMQTLNADEVLEGCEVLPGFSVRVQHVFL